MRNPVLVHTFYNARRQQLQQPEIQPNLAHHALAELEAILGDRFLLITQNIDNLHQRAGNKSIVPMHGELLKVRCCSSGHVFPWLGNLEEDERCYCCQFPSRLRPHVVWFGEMPLGMEKIYPALEKADYFVSIGTSGQVYPAAGFVQAARACGAYTVELNLEASQTDHEFFYKDYGLATKVVPIWVDKFLKHIGYL